MNEKRVLITSRLKDEDSTDIIVDKYKDQYEIILFRRNDKKRYTKVIFFDYVTFFNKFREVFNIEICADYVDNKFSYYFRLENYDHYIVYEKIKEVFSLLNFELNEI